MNGQEKVDEITGVTGSHTTALFWEYDTRLGRRWNIDPKGTPSYSPYATFKCNPIIYSDVLGDTVKFGKGIERVINKIVHSAAWIGSKSYREQYKKWDSETTVYQLNPTHNNPILIDGGEITTPNPDDPDFKYINYSIGNPSPNDCAGSNSCTPYTGSDQAEDRDRRLHSQTQTWNVSPGTTITFDLHSRKDKFEIYSGGSLLWSSGWTTGVQIIELDDFYSQGEIECNQIDIKVTTGVKLATFWEYDIFVPCDPHQNNTPQQDQNHN